MRLLEKDGIREWGRWAGQAEAGQTGLTEIRSLNFYVIYNKFRPQFQ